MKNKKTKERSFWKWAPVFVLSLALAIIIIDTTLLNVSLSYLIKDLHTDIQKLQWVITAYSLTLAALTITGGRLGDLFGRKKMFLLGALLFAIGSFLASISSSFAMLVTGESIIEGVGAALMMPATASLLVSTYKGRDRAIAMGMWGGVAAASSAIGPILGGYLTSNFSWRWGFRINIFVVLVLLVLSPLIKESSDKEEKPTLDLWGVLLSSIGLLALVYGFIESSKYGWWNAKQPLILLRHTLSLSGYSIVPFSILLGLIILSFFILWELRVARKGNTPLVSMRLFQNSQFNSGMAVTTIMSLAQAGMIFSIPVFLQSVRQLDAFHTGLAFLPMSLTALVFAPLSAVLSHKVSPKRLIQTGLFLSVIAIFVIRQTLNVESTATDFIPGMILYGAGIGLNMAALSNLTLSAVSVQEAGEASGVNNTMRQIGSTLGSAIIGAALLTALSTNIANGISESEIIPNQAKQAVLQQVASQSSNVEFGGGAKLSGNIPPTIKDEVVKVSHQATTDSNKLALLYTILFTSLGFLASIFLPNSKDIEKNRSVAAGH